MTKKKAKVEIKNFKLNDYVRFLRTKVSPKTRKEFSRSLMGYLIAGIKSVTSKNKYHRFTVFVDGKFVGFGAIFNERGFDEISLFTLPKFRGRGIATETTRKLIDHAFKKLGLKKIAGVVDDDNPALITISKRLGLKLVRQDGNEKIFEKVNTGENLWRKKGGRKKT